MELEVPLTLRQIKAAGELYAHLEQCTAADHALLKLGERFPGFDADSALLKVVTINGLYGTHVFAIVRMAQHVQRVLADPDTAAAGVELVERLARLPLSRPDEKPLVFLSFASKFAHFFVDAKRFPILDRYAEQMVKLHLGPRNIIPDAGSRYATFVGKLNRLRELAPWSGSNRELDRYLWLAGGYRAWCGKAKTPINAELQRLFANPPPGARAELGALLPAILDQAFKGQL
ncbi:MAG: hypothetical protein V2A79_15430 [Planctomycetota bacterium]